MVKRDKVNLSCFLIFLNFWEWEKKGLAIFLFFASQNPEKIEIWLLQQHLRHCSAKLANHRGPWGISTLYCILSCWCALQSQEDLAQGRRIVETWAAGAYCTFLPCSRWQGAHPPFYLLAPFFFSYPRAYSILSDQTLEDSSVGHVDVWKNALPQSSAIPPLGWKAQCMLKVYRGQDSGAILRSFEREEQCSHSICTPQLTQQRKHWERERERSVDWESD